MFLSNKLFALLQLWKNEKRWLKAFFQDKTISQVQIIDLYVDVDENVMIKMLTFEDKPITVTLLEILELEGMKLNYLTDEEIDNFLQGYRPKSLIQPLVKPMAEKFIFTVSGLTQEIKVILSTNFEKIWVQGEIQEVKLSYGGHMFLTLKDEQAVLSMVMFSSKLKKVKFNIKEGMEVECYGSISIYEKRGNYQLVLERILPQGEGEIDLAFRQLCDKFKQEGLFNLEYKKTIPRYAEKIAIITSPHGAALKDILKTIDLEYPEIEVFIFPVTVQGEMATEEIAEMIAYVNTLNFNEHLDLIVLTRGGGSKEDLWCFNEEKVVRAIFASRLPIISAVGHEVDYLISDLVADYRAATPTAAAEYITKKKKELIYRLKEEISKLMNSFQTKFQQIKNAINQLSIKNVFTLLQHNLISQKHHCNDITKTFQIVMRELVNKRSQSLEILNAKLVSLSPQAVLKRGYKVIYREDKIISDLKKLHKDDLITIKNQENKKEARIL